MRLQSTKLSASGVDIGSPMLFASRIGFSGTPSNLLPLSLRNCIYDAGTQAHVVRTFVDPSISASEPFSLDSGNPSEALLRRAARGDFHALVDTGAVITGLSQRETAYRLLQLLPSGFDAVAYVDEAGEKRALVRGEDLGAPPTLLKDIGVAKERRFSFYDQARFYFSQ
jgi:hypothetical protein